MAEACHLVVSRSIREVELVLARDERGRVGKKRIEERRRCESVPSDNPSAV